MDYIYLAAMTGTVFMLPAYIYLYFLYRERYMGLWILSWFVFFARIIIFDYGPVNWKEAAFGFIIYQAMFISGALIFLWGMHIFANRGLGKRWLYAAAAAVLLSAVFTLADMPMVYKLLPSAGMSGVILVQIGRLFTRHLQIKGVGNFVTGYAFIVWGPLTAVMPYTLGIPWLSPWCYFLGGILRFIITLGMLLVYFEKTRADLAEKERQYRLLAENAVDVIYRLRLQPRTEFEYVSQAALAVTGYMPEEFYAAGELLEKIIYSDDQPLFNKLFRNPSLSGEIPLSFRLVRKDKQVVWIEQKGVPIVGKDGNVVALEGILRDVTARKNMEQLIFQAEKMNMVGQMAVSVAHEIRNPLTSVRGYLQLLRMKEECQHKERFDLMINELDRTNTIISEYLLLAKDKVPDRKRCSLNGIIHAVFPLLQANAIAAKAALKLALSDIPPLFLDEHEIRQLLFNLVNNGLEAMPLGGEVCIRTFPERDHVVLAVSDQGNGIPPNILANLGTPFLTTKANGTGLGLPVCYRIATRHDAIINVETNGQGTTFLVSFDVLKPAV